MRGLFGSIAEGLERKSVDVSALTWSKLWGEDAAVKSGVSVTTDSAFRVTVVLICARVISEGLAQFPFKLYRELEAGGSEVAKDHSLHRLIHRRPNPWMTSFEFREALTLHAVMTGNGYAFKNMIRDEVKELIPLVPNCTTVHQQPDSTLRYEYNTGDGKMRMFSADQILHIRGPSWNGYLGMNVVQLAREAIGLAIATEETHSRFHANAAQPGGVLSIKGALDDKGRQRLKEQWLQFQTGMQNKYKTAVLDQDATWTPLTMSGVDAQHLETRKHQIEEVCRAFRVFPQMAGFSDKTSTFASAESFFIAHVQHCLGPWVERWEQAVTRDLIGDAKENASLFAKLNVTAMLRGTPKARAEYFKAALGSGGAPAWMTQDEVRALEELNPMGGEAAALPKPSNVSGSAAAASDDDDEEDENDA